MKERGRRLSTPHLPGKLPYRIDDSDLEEEATGYGKLKLILNYLLRIQRSSEKS